MAPFLEIVRQSSRPVVVFGASVLGKAVLDALGILNVHPVLFCDNDVQKQKELFHGYRVVPFDALCREHPDVLVVIAAGRYFREIQQQLSDAGFRDMFSDSDVLNCIDFKKTPLSRLKGIVWHLAKIGKLAEIEAGTRDGLHIPRLNVVLTTRCTLKCEHCSSLMGHYQTPCDVSTPVILKSLGRILSAAGLIYHVEVLGGEPFLNKDFPVVVRHLLDSGKTLHIDIVTNGTLLPSEEALECLKDESVSVVIDDYGTLSVKAAALSDALQRRGIDYRINRHWAWADLGGFKTRNRSEKQLAGLFAKCYFNSCTELLDGKLFRCPRSSHGTKTGLLPEYKEDFIDILEKTPDSETDTDALATFLHDKTFVHACNHCDGNTHATLTLPPPGQIAKGGDR